MRIGLGIDLGGTQIKGAAFDLDSGDLLHRETRPTRDGKSEGQEPAFAFEARQLKTNLESETGHPAEILGLSAPGLANHEATVINFMPGRLDGLEGLNWPDVFDQPVAVLNDAHAALMGEIWQGGARGMRDVILLTLGTGVGGAAVVDGQLLRGHLGRAGHLGHIALDFRGKGDICGTPGSLEDFVGNHNISERSGGRFSTTHELIAALESGDETAASVWNESMQALAAGIASLVNVLDPRAVLIGGGISRGWEHIEPRASEWLDKFEWRPGGARVELRRAELGEWAGTYGAVYFAMQQFLQQS